MSIEAIVNGVTAAYVADRDAAAQGHVARIEALMVEIEAAGPNALGGYFDEVAEALMADMKKDVSRSTRTEMEWLSAATMIDEWVCDNVTNGSVREALLWDMWLNGAELTDRLVKEALSIRSTPAAAF